MVYKPSASGISEFRRFLMNGMDRDEFVYIRAGTPRTSRYDLLRLAQRFSDEGVVFLYQRRVSNPLYESYMRQRELRPAEYPLHMRPGCDYEYVARIMSRRAAKFIDKVSYSIVAPRNPYADERQMSHVRPVHAVAC